MSDDGWIVYVDDLSVLMPGWWEQVKLAMAGNYVACGAFRKVNKLVVEVKSGEIGTITVDFLAKTGQARASGGTPSFAATPATVTGGMSGVFAFNGANYSLRMFRATIDNKLTPIDTLDAYTTAEPERSAQPEYTFEIELHSRDDALYNAHLALTQSDATITFTHPTLGYSMLWTLHNAVIETCTTPLDGPGPLVTRARLRGLSDGTDLGMAILITNATSSGLL